VSRQDRDQSSLFSAITDRYRALFENSPDAILIIEDGKFIECNKAAIDMMGFPDKNTLLQTHPSSFSPEYQPDGQLSLDKANAIMANVSADHCELFEWVHIRGDGELFTVEVLLTEISSTQGRTLHTVWRDISERKRLEKELRHSQKMDLVGKLSSGIAHDFNNHLVPIVGYSEMLVDSLKDQPELAQWATEIQRASKSASTLVNKLLLFSRKEVEQVVTLDMNKTVAELLKILGSLVGEDIAVRFEAATGPLWISIGPGDIEQIVLNLATNSRDALPDGGEVKVSLSLVQRGESSFARLEVCDDGVGMDADPLEQIYLPFYPTKKPGSGTGLGMSTVYGLVTTAGGQIVIDSEPGEGTTFEVLFPLVDEVEINAQHSDSDDAPRAEDALQKSILVVEDDEQTAAYVERILTRQGHEVTLAASGIEALDRMRSKVPDLLLIDVVMPGMSGPMVVREITAEGIDVPVVYMSGYADDRLVAHGLDVEKSVLVHKPFTSDTLISQVNKILAANATGAG